MEQLGDYIVQKKLGHGAFGEVFLAEHRFIKRPFVLKVLPEEISSDPQFLRRFEMQVSEIAELDHPHILKIHNVSIHGGRAYLVMDPVIDSLGETMHLERFLQLKGKALSEGDQIALLSQVASAIDAAHEARVAHGGLKLSNILAAPDEYGAPLGSVNFGGEIFYPSSVAELAANSESLQERAMRWDKKDAEKNSLDLTAGRKTGVKLLLSDFGLSRLIGEGLGVLRIRGPTPTALF